MSRARTPPRARVPLPAPQFVWVQFCAACGSVGASERAPQGARAEHCLLHAPERKKTMRWFRFALAPKQRRR